MEPRPYISVFDVARMLNVSTKWVYQHIGEIPGAFRIGRSWFIDREILITSLKEKAKRPAPKRVDRGGHDNRHGLL